MPAEQVPSPDALRKVVWWVLTGASLVVFALLVPIPFKGRVVVALGDLCHAPLFAAVTLGVLSVLQLLRPIEAIRRLLWRCVAVAFCLVAFGASMEYVQGLLGRSAAWHDAFANALGIIAASLWYLGRRVARPTIKRLLWFCSVCLIALAWYQPFAILHDVWRTQSQYPLLCSFESDMQLTRWYFRGCSAELTATDVTDGQYSAEIRYEPQDFPAATMIEFASDWSDMTALEFDVALADDYPGDSVTMMVSVLDHQRRDDSEDIYRSGHELRRGQATKIRISREALLGGPKYHRLNLSDLQYLDLALVEPVAPARIRVDHVRVLR